MQDAYSEVCLMFSENPKTTEPADFFGLFSKFTKEWKVSKAINSLILIVLFPQPRTCQIIN